MAQLAVSVAGAAVGFAMGGPTGAQWGWMAGSVIGGLLFPTRIEGPRIADLRVQNSAYGQPIPIATTVIANDLPVRDTGSGSGASMLSRLLGAAFGIALLGTVVASVTGAAPAHADADLLDRGIGAAYAAGGVLMLAGLLVVARWSPVWVVGLAAVAGWAWAA